jgi:hypothetical protein
MKGVSVVARRRLLATIGRYDSKWDAHCQVLSGFFTFIYFLWCGHSRECRVLPGRGEMVNIDRKTMKSANQHTCSASVSELQNCMVYINHADDSEGPGAAAWARTDDTTRLRRADPAVLGAT